MKLDPDFCRSLLFLPGNNDRFLNSALRGSADVIILDMEDAIPAREKEQTRAQIQTAIKQIHESKRVCSVRINNDLRLIGNDLEAAIVSGLSALTIPKVSSAEQLQWIDEAVTELESERNLETGAIRLIAQIETVQGLQNIDAIAHATPRLIALGIGPEDLAANLGCEVDEEALYYPNMQALIAARGAGIVPLGYLGSITVYNEPERYQKWIQQARKLGFEGAFCIHPNQVEILNSEFLPTPDEIADSRELIDVFEAQTNKGIGAFAFKGKMVDAPIIARAKRILKRTAQTPK